MMSEIDRLVAIYGLANNLLKSHGLKDQGWTFELSGGKRQIGHCDYNDKCIRYSKHFLYDTSWEEITDTILHEIAHALVGPDAEAHGSYWKSVARRIGARPNRTSTNAVLSKEAKRFNFKLECPSCGDTCKRYRRKKGLQCRKCKVPLKTYRLIYKEVE